LGLQEFDSAVRQFQEAQKLFPKRKIVTEKIALAKRLKIEYQHRQELAKQEVQTAQRYLLIKNYSDALTHLQKADSMMPGNAAIISKINQIEPLARKQKAYTAKANEADKLYITKNYMAAKVKYEEAEALWPDNPYPKDMIDRIDATLLTQKAHLDENYQTAIHQADSLFRIPEPDNAKAEYSLALTLKPGESYPQEQLKKIDLMSKKELAAKEARYKQIIHQGDSLFNKKQYLASRDIFSKALTLKPNDTYPQQKLKEIANALIQQAAQEKAEAQYQELITSGNQFFDTKQWDLSLQKYKMASQLKPEESYPKDKIVLIRKILADSAQQQKMDALYAQQMHQGDLLKDGKQWDDAKKTYEKALTFKPGAEEPRRAIAQIDSILQQLADQKKVDLAYKKAILEGDSLLAAKSYQPALEAFQKAADLKPSELTPKQKIESINQTLAALEHQKQVDKKFAETIQQADSLLKQKSYEMALNEYQAAVNLKQNESYPKEKIKEVRGILAQMAKERELRYQQALSTANASFQAKDYQQALQQYKTASSIKPDENYPKQQIQQCQQLLAATYQKRKNQYDQEIAVADKFYHDKAYDQAIEIYKIAHHILAEEPYPMDMVQKITKYISDNAIEDVIKQKVLIQSNETKQFTFKPIPIKVRQSNYVLVKATNVNGNSFNVIFTFGQGKSKNGGFVVRVPKGKGSHNFIIRIGSQYKWFSEDNDWISVFTENNPLEVSLIRISKSE
jgi:tetratricopeptide (TPR) repeat protein